MKNMFSNCNSLEYLDISNFNPNIKDSDGIDSMLDHLLNII